MESISQTDMEMLEAIMDSNLETSIEEQNVVNNEIIPNNSESYMVNEETSRFSSAIWFEKIKTLTPIIAGVGGIGSYVVYLMSRLHPAKIYIYDPDTVETVNMSGQLYGSNDVGNTKVLAIRNIVYNYSNYYNVVSYDTRYTSNSINGPIMICGFDNMEARRTFFDRWLSYVHNLPRNERKNCLFIDGRLAAEELQVLSIQGNDDRAIEMYEKEWLFTDAEAETTVCSYKQTSFMANMIASYMVNVFVNFAANISDEAPIIPRDVPFLITYNAENMFTNILM
jgi:molybdopterin/thiamine biosynthesis adenylyltransferase